MRDECRRAIEHLSMHLAGSESQPVEVRAAIAHIQSCQECLRNTQALLQALSITEEDTLSCAACQELLPDYHHALSEGQADAARWHPLARHLQVCPHCAIVYAELAAMVAIGDDDQAEAPAAYPTPQLSFLRPKPAITPTGQQAWWHWNQQGRLVITPSAELLRSLPPPPQSAYAAAQHRAGAPMVPLWLLTLDEELHNLAVRITAARRQNDPEHCTLLIDVNMPNRGWPDLAGSQVVLKHNDQLIETKYTDAFGKAVFEAIVIADLFALMIEIEPTEVAFSE